MMASFETQSSIARYKDNLFCIKFHKTHSFMFFEMVMLSTHPYLVVTHPSQFKNRRIEWIKEEQWTKINKSVGNKNGCVNRTTFFESLNGDKQTWV